MSAQKALRGSETETRELLGGTEENCVSPMRGHDLPSRQINEFLQKGNRKELVARPGDVVLRKPLNDRADFEAVSVPGNIEAGSDSAL